jgi:hypothetical protein
MPLTDKLKLVCPSFTRPRHQNCSSETWLWEPAAEQCQLFFMEPHLMKAFNHRLRMESSGGERLRRVVRLEVQRHMQLRGKDLGGPQ